MPARFGLAAMGSRTGTIFLIDEDFETTGAPSGWSVFLGTANWDYTAVPLAGAQSLYMTTAGISQRVAVDWTDQTEVYLYFMLRFTNGVAPGSTASIGSLTNNGNNSSIVTFQVGVTGRLFFGPTNPTATTSIDTTYHVWLHYKQGTGANAVLDIGFSTTGVRPTSGTGFASTSTNAATALAGRLFIGTGTVTAGGWDTIWDKVRVSTTLIGDNGT